MAGKGRKRVENKLIENPSSRMVCFSKRRKGLFKKAEELSILTGAKTSVFTFSQAGNLYCSDSQTFDSLLCPQVVMSSEIEREGNRESALAETMAADSILCPQLEMSTETEVNEDGAFAEAMAADPFPCPQFEMSAKENVFGSDFAGDMVEEAFSSEVPTINSLLCPEVGISSENDAWKSVSPVEDINRNSYNSAAAAFEPLPFPQFDISRETEAEICWDFDFAEAMAGKKLPFWYNRPNVQAMGREELQRFERAILEYGQMQLSKHCYR